MVTAVENVTMLVRKSQWKVGNVEKFEDAVSLVRPYEDIIKVKIKNVIYVAY